MTIQLHDLLDTKNKGEQVKRVEHLLQLASSPVIDLVIRYDPRNGSIGLTAIGVKDLSTEDIHQILTAAKETLRQQEKATLQQQAARPTASPEAEPTEVSTPKTEETPAESE